MCQKRSNINVSFSLHFARCLSVVDHRYEPVSVVPDIENHVAIYGVCVFEYAANFRDAVPANRFNNGFPRSNLVSCIGVLFYGLLQMLKRNDMHQGDSTSQYVKLSSLWRTQVMGEWKSKYSDDSRYAGCSAVSREM